MYIEYMDIMIRYTYEPHHGALEFLETVGLFCGYPYTDKHVLFLSTGEDVITISLNEIIRIKNEMSFRLNIVTSKKEILFILTYIEIGENFTGPIYDISYFKPSKQN